MRPALASIDSLGQRAADLAMRGAAAYLRRTGRTLDAAGLDALVVQLRRLVPVATLRAMDDAKEAFAANMADAAVATFAATLQLVGVRAAKVALCEEDPS